MSDLSLQDANLETDHQIMITVANDISNSQWGHVGSCHYKQEKDPNRVWIASGSVALSFPLKESDSI